MVRYRPGTAPSRYELTQLSRHLSAIVHTITIELKWVCRRCLFLTYPCILATNAEKDQLMAKLGIPKLIRKLVMWPRIRVSTHLVTGVCVSIL